MKSNPVQEIFERASVVKTITLSMLTFGLYVVYKLYDLSLKLNPKVVSPISKWFMNTSLAITLVSYAGFLVYFSTDASQQLLITFKLIHVVSSAFHLVWILKVRNRINEVSAAEKGSKVWLHPFMSTFFHVIYMQYKINEALSDCDVEDHSACQKMVR